MIKSDKRYEIATKEDTDAFTKRIDDAADRIGGVVALVKATGLSRSVIDKYRNGVSDPSRARLNLIAEAAGVSVEWLATGKGSVEPKDFFENGGDNKVGSIVSEIHSVKPQNTANLHHVPMINVPASAGGGAVVLDERQSGYLGIDPAWLRTQWGVNPNDLFAMPVTGESMEPTIKAGESLLCSRSIDYTKPGDGIYIVRLDGNLLVKRIQVLPGGKVVVSSDNSAFYKPFEVILNEGTDFTILAKVVLVHGLRRV